MDNRVALVTGANRGIGHGIVKGLANEGYTVLMASRKTDVGLKARKGMEGDIEVVELDVTNENSILLLKASIEKNYGKLDVLINNAGIIGRRKKDFAEGDVDEIREIMETNYFGPMRMNAAFLDLLKKSEDGRIVNMSSGMGALDELTSGYAGYRLSKAGLNSQSILLANELSGQVKVFAMCPGWVRTDMGGSNASRSIEEGADTAIYLATSDDAISGKFYRDRSIISW